MKIAIYPGSFNPWHVGHSDILNKTLKVFDQVIVSVGINPEKTAASYDLSGLESEFKHYLLADYGLGYSRVVIKNFTGLLVDHARECKADAIIRGLRNGNDLQYEMNQQYWNEDLGLTIPIVYFITDRKYGHISSSMIRALNIIKK